MRSFKKEKIRKKVRTFALAAFLNDMGDGYFEKNEYSE